MLSKNPKKTFTMRGTVLGSNLAFRAKMIKLAHFPFTHQPSLANDRCLKTCGSGGIRTHASEETGA